MSIAVTNVGKHAYRVELRDRAGTETAHDVKVPAGMIDELGLDELEEESLVRRSFQFLLEREPPSSILRRFDLDVIGRYFPEYLDEIRQGP